MGEIEMLKMLQSQILGCSFEAFKDNIDVKRLTGIKMKHPHKRNAQKELFRIALEEGKVEMRKVLEERLAAIKAQTNEKEMFETISDIIRESCNTHADAYFEAYQASEMHEIETIWKLEYEMKLLDDHVEFLKKSEAELSQPGLSEQRRNIMKKRIKMELEERNDKFGGPCEEPDEPDEPPTEAEMEKITEELGKSAKKEGKKLEDLCPALQTMVKEMNNSFEPHEYVYPPPPEPGTIRIPTGGLAKCCCSKDCQEELMEPAYLVLGMNPGDERWKIDDNEPLSSHKAKQDRKKKKK